MSNEIEQKQRFCRACSEMAYCQIQNAILTYLAQPEIAPFVLSRDQMENCAPAQLLKKDPQLQQPQPNKPAVPTFQAIARMEQPKVVRAELPKPEQHSAFPKAPTPPPVSKIRKSTKKELAQLRVSQLKEDILGKLAPELRDIAQGLLHNKLLQDKIEMSLELEELIIELVCTKEEIKTDSLLNPQEKNLQKRANALNRMCFLVYWFHQQQKNLGL